VIVTAATKSSEPLGRAATAARDRAVIVVVGDVGMELDRRPFYDRELTLRVARSYGPGRYDPDYEDLGIDYPAGHVRWTARRNMQSFLDLIAAGKIEVADLITHRFAFERAPDAYAMLDGGAEPYIGIVLEYPSEPAVPAPSARNQKAPTAMTAGLVGAGQFAERVLVPAASRAGFTWAAICSASGAGAERIARSLESAVAVSEPASVTEDAAVPVVFVATRHDSHARFVVDALAANKHVFCEKPLALTEDDLAGILAAWESSSGALMVGFNRRWSPAVADIARHVGGRGPLQIIYRVNAGALPDGHWLLDRRMGGRLLGEACHFVDTCSAIVGDDPVLVSTMTSGRDELLLDQDFTISLGFADGSQATVVYAAHSSTRPGKERIEVMGGDRSVIVDDFHRLEVFGPDGHSVERYRPADKGHNRELQVFAEIVTGRREADGVAQSAFRTSRAMFAAVESAMTGRSVTPGY
jgi:predicted dehydrogenase